MAADEFHDSIHIEADPEVVFDYFIKPEALVQWLGDRAILEPRPGGRFTLFFAERAVEGRYVEIDRPRRVVITWGRAGSSVLPPRSSRLEVTLTPEAGGTRVAIVHTGLPASEIARHALGWRHYLARLAIVGAGGTVEPHRAPEEIMRGLPSRQP